MAVSPGLIAGSGLKRRGVAGSAMGHSVSPGLIAGSGLKRMTRTANYGLT